MPTLRQKQPNALTNEAQYIREKLLTALQGGIYRPSVFSLSLHYQAIDKLACRYIQATDYDDHYTYTTLVQVASRARSMAYQTIRPYLID